MSTQVEIANQALGWLGAQLITSIEDPSVEAQLVKANWNPIYRAVLEAREWTFVVARKILTPLASSPVFGSSRSFQLPADCIRVLTVRSDAQEDNTLNTLDWRREGDEVIANADKLYIRYLRDEPDPSRYTPAFTQALAARLAWDLATPLTESNSKAQMMAQKYEYALKAAAGTDALQGRNTRIRNNGYGHGFLRGNRMGPFV